MSTIIALATDKGGAGKSTLAKHLGKWLHDKNFKVVIYDGDQSNNIINFVSRRSELLGNKDNTFPEVKVFPLNLKKDTPESFINRDASEADFVIVDLVGKLGNLHTQVMSAAHIIIVPAQLDTESIDGAIATFDFIEDGEIIETDSVFPIPIISLCDWDKKTPAGIKASKNHEFKELPKFDQVLGPRRRKYINASNEGLTVFDKVVKDKSFEPAVFEMNRFCKEVLDLVEDIAKQLEEME